MKCVNCGFDPPKGTVHTFDGCVSQLKSQVEEYKIAAEKLAAFTSKHTDELQRRNTELVERNRELERNSERMALELKADIELFPFLLDRSANKLEESHRIAIMHRKDSAELAIIAFERTKK